MLIRLAEIIDEPVHWAETKSIAAASLGNDLVVDLGPVTWTGEVRRTSEGHLLQARLEYEQKLACPRCLKPTAMSVAADVKLVIEQRGGEPEADEVELGEEDLDAFVVEGDELDTDPIVIEQLQLNIPMRKLCREDCRGLCPSCGVDRNEVECQCEEQTIDPRWEALRGFRAGE